MFDDTAIIGLSLGSRNVGVAVLKNGELRECRVKLIRASTPAERLTKLRNILTKLITHYKPARLALKSIHPSRSSQLLRQAVNEVTRVTSDNKLALRSYSLVDLKDEAGQTRKANKKLLARACTVEHPILTQAFSHPSAFRLDYHMRAFEALAAAQRCRREGTRQRSHTHLPANRF